MLQTSVVQTHLTFQKNREELKDYGPCLLDDILYKGVLLFTLRERWIFFCLLNNQKYRRKYRISSFKQPKVRMKLLVAQACPTLLCPPGSVAPVHGILQARMEQVAFPFSRDLPHPGIESRSPALQADYLSSESSGMLHTLAVGMFYSNKML